MKLSQFNFELPADRIAQEPTRWRDEARLMVLHKDTGAIEHRLFKDIIDYFGKGDTFVLNDTKVFPRPPLWQKREDGGRYHGPPSEGTQPGAAPLGCNCGSRP
jgi:S-adenosylmethionine:tRNA ribosyltransferase-isomerase